MTIEAWCDVLCRAKSNLNSNKETKMLRNKRYLKFACWLVLMLVSVVGVALPALAADYWTAWLDRDNPSGQADSERLALHQADGNVPCDAPVDVECRTTSGTPFPADDYFDAPYDCTATHGLKCWNDQQSGYGDGVCEDWEIRFKCQMPVVSLTCDEVSHPKYSCTGSASQGKAPFTPWWKGSGIWFQSGSPGTGPWTRTFLCTNPMSIQFKVVDANGDVSNVDSAACGDGGP